MNQKKPKNYLLFMRYMAHRISLAIHGHNHFSVPPIMLWFPVFREKSKLKKTNLYYKQ